MFRRLFWFVTGASAALWGRSKVLQAIDKYIPASVTRVVKRTAGNLLDEFKIERQAAAERARELSE